MGRNADSPRIGLFFSAHWECLRGHFIVKIQTVTDSLPGLSGNSSTQTGRGYIGVTDLEAEEYWAQQADLLHAYEALIPEDDAEELTAALDPNDGWDEFLRFLDLLNAMEALTGVRVGGKETPRGDYAIGILDDITEAV